MDTSGLYKTWPVRRQEGRFNPAFPTSLSELQCVLGLVGGAIFPFLKFFVKG